MTVEEDIAELKTDVKWIKQSISDIKRERSLNKGYLVAIIGAVIISITSLIVGLVK